MWNTRHDGAAGKAHGVVSRGHPSKHRFVTQCSPSLKFSILQEEDGTVREQADTIKAMEIDAQDGTEQGEGARKEPHT